MEKTIVGVFKEATAAKSAIQALRDFGIKSTEVSLLTREDAKKHILHDVEVAEADTYTADKAVNGAGIGAALGGVAGLILGITTLAVPGVGPVVAAGTLALMITGASVGAVEGMFLAAVTHLGIERDHIPFYVKALNEGKTIVAVHVDDRRVGDVCRLLADVGAEKTATYTHIQNIDYRPRSSPVR